MSSSTEKPTHYILIMSSVGFFFLNIVLILLAKLLKLLFFPTLVPAKTCLFTFAESLENLKNYNNFLENRKW